MSKWDFNQFPDGFFLLSIKIAEKLAQISLPGYSARALWAIFRKTYGYGKKKDQIPLSQLSELTGIDRRHLHRAVQDLVEAGIITVTKSGTGRPSTIAVNNRFGEWRAVTKSGYKKAATVTNLGNTSAVTNPGRTCTQLGNTTVTNPGTLNIIRKNKQKNGGRLKYDALLADARRRYPAAPLIVNFFVLTMDDEERRLHLPKPQNWTGKYNWLNTIKQLHVIDGYEWWKIFDIIYYARVEDVHPRNGDFCWKKNLFTIPALRKKSKTQDTFKINVIYEQIKDELQKPNINEIEYIAKEVEKYAQNNKI